MTIYRGAGSAGSGVAADYMLDSDLSNTSDTTLGDALIGFKQSTSSGALTGATARTVHGKLQDVISVFDFMSAAEIADVAAGSLTVDVSAAIQAAIDAVAGLGGGTIYFPSGKYRCESAISVTGIGVKLVGQGTSFFTNAPARSFPTEWVYYGASTTDFVLLSSVSGSSNRKVTDCALDGIAFDGNSLVQNVVHVRSVNQCHFNVSAQGGSVSQFKVDCVTSLLDATSTQHNDFEFIRVYALSSAHGILLTSTALGGNTSMNNFGYLYGYHENGDGVRIENGDNNVFFRVSAQLKSGGTGVGLRLCAGDGVVTAGAYSNMFFGVSPGSGQVYAEGTPTDTTPSTQNTILFLDKANGANDPTIETDATLHWGSNNGMTMMFGAMAQAGFGTSHSTAKSAVAAIGSAAARFRGAIQIDAGDESTLDWRITTTGSDLYVNRIAGSGYTRFGQAVKIPIAVEDSTTDSSSGGLGTSTAIHFLDCSGGNKTFSLPLANTFGANKSPIIFLKRTDVSGNTCTLARQSSDTIDGATSITLAASTGILLVTDGSTAWHSI